MLGACFYTDLRSHDMDSKRLDLPFRERSRTRNGDLHCVQEAVGAVILNWTGGEKGFVEDSVTCLEMFLLARSNEISRNSLNRGLALTRNR